MAKLAIKSETAKQKGLFPIDIADLIPQTHIVRAENTLIDRLDISEIFGTYKGGGTSAFSPRTMVKVPVYAYLCNICTSRKIEQALCENVTFMWLSGMSHPNWRTINYFRGKRLKAHFDSLFTQVVVLLYEQGFVSLKVQYVDGNQGGILCQQVHVCLAQERGEEPIQTQNPFGCFVGKNRAGERVGKRRVAFTGKHQHGRFQPAYRANQIRCR